MVSTPAPMQVVALTISFPQGWTCLLLGPTSSQCPGIILPAMALITLDISWSMSEMIWACNEQAVLRSGSNRDVTLSFNRKWTIPKPNHSKHLDPPLFPLYMLAFTKLPIWLWCTYVFFLLLLLFVIVTSFSCLLLWQEEKKKGVKCQRSVSFPFPFLVDSPIKRNHKRKTCH